MAWYGGIAGTSCALVGSVAASAGDAPALLISFTS